MSGSNIKTADRVDAVIAAKDLLSDLASMGRESGYTHAVEAAHSRAILIINRLRDAHVDRATIRHHIVETLGVPPSHWRVAFIRLHAAALERALGLAHDPRSIDALTAWEAADGRNRSWDDYSDALLRKPVAIEIPATPAECSP